MGEGQGQGEGDKNMKKIFSKFLLIAHYSLLITVFAGCEKNPVNRLIDPTISNTTGNWSGEWVIYDDEIRTGGTVMMFNTMDGQELDFSSRDNSKSGSKCIKYSWNGGDVTAYKNLPAHPVDYVEHDFTGFSLIAADDFNNYNAVSKDLTEAGYTKISFWVRGSLYSNVHFRLEANNGNNQTASGNNAWMSNTTDRKVTSSWQKYEFTVSGNMTTVRDFVRIVFRYDKDGNPDNQKGNGGTVFIDDIRLTK